MDIDKEGMNLNYGIWINEENKVAGGFETEIGEDFIVQSLERLNDRNWHYVILMYNGMY